MSRPNQRAAEFCTRFGLKAPVLMAPMAGASPPALAAAVAQAGGMGACGALPLDAAGIVGWAARFRQMTDRPFQINLWVPDPPPDRDVAAEAAMARFLATFGPEPALPAPPFLPDFDSQFAALLAAAPPVASTIMGLFRPDQVSALKAAGIAWFATATTPDEARAAAAAGADAVIAQGAEAGGHRGCFDPADGARAVVGSMALISSVADAIDLPVIAAGGIGDGRGLAAALALGASAAIIGTALLRAPEAGIAAVWADALADARPGDTVLTRAFTGRWARTLRNAFTEAAGHPAAPPAAPYPLQRHLTEPMRLRAIAGKDRDHCYALAGQSAWLARTEPAGETVNRIWREAQALIA